MVLRKPSVPPQHYFIVEVASGVRPHIADFALRRLPSNGTSRRRLFIRSVWLAGGLVQLAQERKRLDPGQDWKGGDCSRASECPCGPARHHVVAEAHALTGRHSRLNAFADVQPGDNFLVRIEFDGATAHRTQKLAPEFDAVRVEEGARDSFPARRS